MLPTSLAAGLLACSKYSRVYCTARRSTDLGPGINIYIYIDSPQSGLHVARVNFIHTKGVEYLTREGSTPQNSLNNDARRVRLLARQLTVCLSLCSRSRLALDGSGFAFRRNHDLLEGYKLFCFHC